MSCHKEFIEAVNKLLPPFVQLKEDSPADVLWAALFRLYGEQVQGPKGHATWKDAAIDAELRAQCAERALGVAGTLEGGREK